MTFKRKPPSGNVRRIAPIEGNLRYTITGKADQTVQCESFQERKLTLLFDRDPSIRTYVSQPERLTYLDAAGKTRTYTPDFMVWRVTGEIEIHEVTTQDLQGARLALPRSYRSDSPTGNRRSQSPGACTLSTDSICEPRCGTLCPGTPRQRVLTHTFSYPCDRNDPYLSPSAGPCRLSPMSSPLAWHAGN